MGEVKPLREFGPTFLKVRYYNGKPLERIVSEPSSKVRLNPATLEPSYQALRENIARLGQLQNSAPLAAAI